MLRNLLPASLSGLADSDCAKTLLLTAVPTAAVGAYLLYCWLHGQGLPPGPAGVPLLGRLPWVDAQHLHLTMQRECQKYGDICSFYLGSRLFIVVNSYPLMKEMLDDPLFAGRPKLIFLQKLSRGCGILNTEGDAWSFQRRLSLRTLRDYGFARAETVRMIDDQLDSIFQSLDECAVNCRATTLLDEFLLASNSIITEMTMGHHFSRDDPDLKKVTSCLNHLFQTGLIQSAPFLFPAVERFVELIPATNARFARVDFMHKFIRGEIRKREEVLRDGASEAHCLCDSYLQEKRKAEQAGDMETFKEFQLIRVCFEFYLAGTDTTARSLEWLMLYMAFYPDVQERVQREIDEVVGQSKRPRMQDKTELHYTCAVIDECYRKASLAATGISHRAMQDTTFHGFRIPSDAMIIPLVYGIHHRADYWEKPNEFYPEHFLDAKGHYRSSTYLVPFLIGRRSCVGESLARMEIFLFFTAILQRYRVRPVPESLARKDEILVGYMGIVRIPGKHQLIISLR